MLEFLVVVTLALHLICVNVASGGPLVCLWLEWRESKGDELAGRAGRFLALHSLLLFLAAIVLGLTVGGLLWSDEYRDSITKLGPRVGFGITEIVFSLVLMAGHVVWWQRSPNCSRPIRLLRSLLPLAASTNLLYHFPFLFIILSRIASGVDVTTEPLDGAGFRARMIEGEVMARAVHFWLASLSVTGIGLLCFAQRIASEKEGSEPVARVAKWGGWIALVPTLLQLPVGMWVLFQISPDRQHRLMGGDAVGSVLFVASLFVALLLMHQLASVAMGNSKPKALRRSVWIMFLVVLLMTGTLRRSIGNAAAEPADDNPVTSVERDDVGD